MPAKVQNLSATIIKTLINAADTFKIKFSRLYYWENEFKSYYCVGSALHSVAEHYTKTQKFDPEVGKKKLDFDFDANIIGVDYTIDEMLLIYKEYENGLISLKELLESEDFISGIAESSITLPNFSGKIDYLATNQIDDYKLVKKFMEHKYFNPNDKYDVKPGYLIQMAIYAYWYYESYEAYPLCRMLETRKTPAIIGEEDVTKEEMVKLIKEQYGVDESDWLKKKKPTKADKLKEYPLKWDNYRIYQVQTDEKFIDFGRNLYTISLALRNAILLEDMKEWQVQYALFKKKCIVFLREFMEKEAKVKKPSGDTTEEE